MPDQLLNQCKITADALQKTAQGWILSGSQVEVYAPITPRRYLYSGWQSWSLTSWIDLDHPLSPMRPSIFYPMHTDPVYARLKTPHGAWYGAVEFPDGQVLFLGALALGSHVQLEGQALKGRYENGQGEWLLAQGTESEIFDHYTHLLAQRFGLPPGRQPLRVWCSWYSLYSEIHQDRLLKILADLGDLPFDVFQIDDGWQAGIGNWEPNARFPSGMDALAAQIRSSGRIAGLWLAPLLIAPFSGIHRNHPDWLLHDEKGALVSAGFNWGHQLYALDTTHPKALDWLSALMKKVRQWGYDYVKADFLYAGALPGKRYQDMQRESAYRHGLKVIREALGDAYLLACGAPILPSLGLCDGLRVGPDVAGYWTSPRDDAFLMNFSTPGARNAIRTTLHHLWLKPLVQTDPDVAYFASRLNRLNAEQRSLLQDLALVAGFKASSDIPAWMVESERAALGLFLENNPDFRKIGPLSYEINDRFVDFTSYIDLPPVPGPLTNLAGILIGALANFPVVLKVFDSLNRRSIQKMLKNNPI